MAAVAPDDTAFNDTAFQARTRHGTDFADTDWRAHPHQGGRA